MSRQNINTGTVPNDGTGDSLRTAFGKVNNNFIEVYNSAVANTWVNPHTSNTWNIHTITGSAHIQLPESEHVTLNTLSNRSGTSYSIFVLKTPESNAIFLPMREGSGPRVSEMKIYLDGVGSTGYISTETLTEWVIQYDGGPPNYTANVTHVDVSVKYEPTPQPWFDPAALGIEDFRSARITYSAFIDNDGQVQTGIVQYAASDGYYYEVMEESTRSRNHDQSISLTDRYETDKLHYKNSDPRAGNLSIQFTATIFTNKDYNHISDE